MKDGKEESVLFDFMVHNLPLSSLMEFSFSVSQLVRCSRGSFVVGEQQR